MEKIMNPEQIYLVQTSLEKLLPVADDFANEFYQRLFEIDPSLRPMFTGDMAEQRKKLMTMLKIVVANLNDLKDLIPAVRALGMRHAQYGVKSEHYITVLNALVWALAQRLGDEFDTATKGAWATAYNILTDVMQEATVAAA
jgi:hemoglobin-like flavoprotein